MTLEIGGRADKLGNRFERLWVVEQLAALSDGEYLSFIWEPLGETGRGIEGRLAIRPDAQLVFQCKESAGQAGRWAIAKLESSGILMAARQHLSGDPSTTFRFVSADPAPYISDLSEWSRRAEGDPSQFVEHSLQSEVHRTAFQKLCRAWDLDGQNAAEQAIAFDLLTRFWVETPGRGEIQVRHVERIIRRSFRGQPTVVLASLSEIAERHLGNSLNRQMLRTALKDNDIEPVALIGQADCLGGVERLKRRFDRSIQDTLLAGDLLQRELTQSLLDCVLSHSGPRVMILQGDPGVGKSCVLFELTTALEGLSIAYLPLRIDRQIPKGTPESFGRDVLSLPDSPVRCLAAIAGEDTGVLLIDQLDAIRWTTSHSADAMDVFVETVEELLAYPNLKLVACCRSFDLTDHPQLQAWKQEQPVDEHVVGQLTPEERDVILARAAAAADRLTSRQRDLLTNPQMLSLWCRLSATGRAHQFCTAADLMREFWSFIRDVPGASNLTRDDLISCLETVLEHMEVTATLCCPKALAQSHPAAYRYLRSNGVLQETEQDRVIFSHQTHYDYLLAERVLREISASGLTIPEWLRSGGQSLFRREQLRLVLSLVRDDSSGAYLSALEQLIADDQIRYHMKHLVWTYLRSLNPPTGGEINLVLALLNNDSLRDPVLSHVVFRQPAWYRALDAAGLIDAWLAGDSVNQRAMALQLISSVAEVAGDEVAEKLGRYMSEEEWRERICDVLSRSRVHLESSRLFSLRLSLLRRGHPACPSVFWSELVRCRPKRAMVLLRGVCRAHVRWLQQGGEKTQSPYGRLEHLYRDDRKDLRHAARRCPETACRLAHQSLQFLSELQRRLRCVRRQELQGDDCGEEGFLTILNSRTWQDLRSVRRLKQLWFRLLTTAGRRLAATESHRFRSLLSTHSGSPSRRMQRSLVEMWQGASINDADEAIAWLIECPLRLDVGSRRHRQRFRPAQGLIERFAPYCSDRQIATLQDVILSFKDEWAIRAFKRSMKHGGRHLDVPNGIGIAQRELLSAIPGERLEGPARSQLAQLTHKFPQRRPPPRPRGRSVFVKSAIPPDRLHLLSDANWLNVVSREWPEGIGYRADGPVDISQDGFAKSLASATTRQPQRFAQFLIKHWSVIPDVHRGECLWVLAHLSRPEGLVPELERDWEPPTSGQIKSLLECIDFCDGRQSTLAFCQLLQDNAHLEYSSTILDLVERFALDHVDPQGAYPEFFRSGRTDDDEHLVQNISSGAMNCVRGVAVSAISRLCWENAALIGRFTHTVEAACFDESYPVRAAAIESLIVLYREAPLRTVNLFIDTVAESEDHLLASHQVSRFLSYTLRDHPYRLQRIVERMTRSANCFVASSGARWVTALWLDSGRYHELFDRCTRGSVEHRAAIAEIAASLVNSLDRPEVALQTIHRAFSDVDSAVRSKAASVFRQGTVIERSFAPSLAQAFVDSPAFLEHASELDYSLPDSGQSLERFANVLLAMCHRVLEIAQTKDGDPEFSGRLPHRLTDKVLRLYEQTTEVSQPALHEQCLDMWDALLRAQPWDAQAILDRM